MTPRRPRTAGTSSSSRSRSRVGRAPAPRRGGAHRGSCVPSDRRGNLIGVSEQLDGARKLSHGCSLVCKRAVTSPTARTVRRYHRRASAAADPLLATRALGGRLITDGHLRSLSRSDESRLRTHAQNCRAAHVISRAIRTTAAPQRDRAADVGTLPLDKRSSQHRRPETGGSHDRSRTARATTTSPSDSRNARQRARPGRRYCSTPPATTLAASLLFGQVGSVSGWLRCSRSSRSD
jgi:hypothetical protein